MGPVAASPLAARPATRARLEFIDGLRALAVVAVFALHVRAFWGQDDVGDGGVAFIVDRIAAQGAAGVDLFIVLSGFCMTYPLIRPAGGLHRLDPLRFYRRRGVRLMPAYYAALVLVIALVLVPGVQRMLVPSALDTRDVIAHLLLVQPFDPRTLSSINGPLWSISLEVTLYLLFPATLLVLRRWGWSCLLVGSLLLAVAWLAVLDLDLPRDDWASVMQFWLPAHFFEFVLGMLAAELVCRPRRRQLAAAAVLLPLAAFVGAVGTVLALSTVRIIGWGVAAFALTVVAGSLATPSKRSTLMSVMAKLGLVSYSFYLLHQPFLLLTSGIVSGSDLPPLALYGAALPVGLLLMYVIARAFFLLFEKPFLLSGSMRDAIRSEHHG